jgi:hypothetical protein
VCTPRASDKNVKAFSTTMPRPNCGSTDFECRTKRFSPYPLGIVAICGLVLTSLHQLSTPVDYRCAKCGLDFGKRTILGRVAGVVLIVFLALTVGMIGLGFVGLVLKTIGELGEP